MPAAQTLSAKEVAIELKTDARTLRKFLREVTPKEDQPGQGGRWTFTKGDVKKLTKKFNDWAEKGAKGKADAVAEATSTKSKKKKDQEPEEIDEVMLVEAAVADADAELELEDLDPSDDEIEDIEFEDDDE